MKKIIECVPNFSEGRDMQIIRRITDEIENVSGVKLLDVDPGKATNRTVVTFAGEPGPVIEAAFLAIQKAGELIDMSNHKGAHPRFGSTDVCPLIPISEITMEETAEYARVLAERVGTELHIPVYCYEFAAFSEDRSNLAAIREGEYEGLPEKLTRPDWKPDFGHAVFNEKTGVTAIGARKVLIAFNMNLNTTSVQRANSVAFDVREQGRVKRENGKVVKDNDGRSVRIPGSLKSVKGIGWYIDEYDIAQVSMNLTNTDITPMHIAFDEVCEKARERGLRVTGSELVGLLPLKEMLAAGRYFLKKQNRSAGVPENELIRIAVKTMGLDELTPFNPSERIIEYVLGTKRTGRLAGMTVTGFFDETSSESPAPGGGSVSAIIGSLGAALGTMVANLSARKKGWEQRLEEFSVQAEIGRKQIDELTTLIDEDTQAFSRIIEACRLPKGTDSEKADRAHAIDDATKYAITVPIRVMEAAYKSMDLIKRMAENGNPNSISDAGVGALCAGTAVRGAFMNVRINAKDLTDREFADRVLAEGVRLEQDARTKEKEIIDIVDKKLI